MKRPILRPVILVLVIFSFGWYFANLPVKIIDRTTPPKQASVDKRNFDNVETKTAYNFALKALKTRIHQSEQSWQKSVERRHRDLQGKKLPEVPDWEPLRGMYFWDYFPPAFTCPYDVERVGRIGDGGKWICGFNTWYSVDNGDSSRNANAKHSCVVYSIGVRDDSSFEEEIIDRTNCKIFAYDFSVAGMASERMQQEPRVKFQSLGIGAKDEGHFKTLSSLMRQNNHEWIDLFKIDVEGSEYEVLDQIITDFSDSLPFGQMLIEMHLRDDDKPNLNTFLPLWERLEKHGLRPFWTETNHNPCVYSKKNPIAVEYSFLNIRAKEFRVPPVN